MPRSLDEIVTQARRGAGTAPDPGAPSALDAIVEQAQSDALQGPDPARILPLPALVTARPDALRQGPALTPVAPRTQLKKPPKEAEPSPGLLDEIFDLLQIGQHTTAGLARGVQLGKSPAEAFKRAGREFANSLPFIEIEGAERPSFTDVILMTGRGKIDPEPLSYLSAVGGFVLDVLLDPTTYFGGKAVELTGKGLKAIPGVTKATETVGKTKVAQTLGKAFIPDFEFTRMVKEGKLSGKAAERFKAARLARQTSVGQGQNEVKEIVTQLAAGMTPEERRLIGLFLDQPGALEGQLAAVAQTPADLARLRSKADAFRSFFRDLADEEQAAGILSPSQVRAHYATGTTPVTKNSERAWQQFIQERGIAPAADQMEDLFNTIGLPWQAGQGTPGFAKPKAFRTLEERVLAGVPTELDIALMSTRRSLESVRQVATRRFVDTVLSDPEIARRVIDPALLQDEHFLKALQGKGYGIYNPLKKGEAPYILPKPIVNELTEADRIFSDNEVLRAFLDKAHDLQNLWKGYAVLSPGFHSRNMVSNWFNNWLAGVRDPRVYRDAMKIQRGKPFSVALKNGLELDQEGVLKLAKDLDVVSAGIFSKDIPADVERALLNDIEGGTFSRVFGQEGALLKANRWLGTQVENNARLANFIDGLRKGLSPDQAALRVKKYLFDYNDLTPFERDFMKAALPFYTWTRKNVPLQFQAIMENPGRYAKVPKLLDAIESISEGWQSFETPDYFQEIHAVRMPFESQTRPVYLNPNLPFQDLNRLNWRGAITSLTPAAKVLIETTPDRGYSIFLDRPVERFPGQMGDVLPVRRKTENLLEGIIPPLGKVDRLIRASRRKELEFQVLSEVIGLKLIPVEPRQARTAKKPVSHREQMGQAMKKYQERKEGR
jgi:hypothetical protein